MRTVIKFSCKFCNKSFYRYPSRKAVFCSRSCQSKGKKKTGFKVGMTPWNKGLKGYRAGEKHDWMPSGEKHWSWKGDSVRYRQLHGWVSKELGKPDTCEHCGKKGSGHQMHWANKSQKYLRRLSDWLRLCAYCHKQYDRSFHLANK